MATEKATCPECGGKMEEGTVADYRRGSIQPSEWVEGRVQSTFWLGNLKNEHRFEITAWRCTRCGFLRFYADKPASSSSSVY